jgi:quercetin dioxygenase-like cupin family protein
MLTPGVFRRGILPYRIRNEKSIMTTASDETRLRQHPARRFAAPEHLIDLHEAVIALRGEPHAGTSGHRQKALYRHGPVECIIFVFEQGSELHDHVVTGGPISIEVLEGLLSVKTAAGERHQMNAGSLLLLAPGVTHSVKASQPTSMLLTVHLDEPNLSPDE